VSLLHLLTWDHQPERRSRSWRNSAMVQRNHVRKALRKNPGLQPHVDEAIAEAYEDARLDAATETDRDDGAFPKHCPYSWDQIMERSIAWPPQD
jgi:hypothetical protein